MSDQEIQYHGMDSFIDDKSRRTYITGLAGAEIAHLPAEERSALICQIAAEKRERQGTNDSDPTYILNGDVPGAKAQRT